MNWRPLLGIFAAVLALLGLVAGMVEWILPQVVVPDEAWNDAMWRTLETTLNLSYLIHVAGYGLALILIGIAVALPVKAQVVAKAPTKAVAPQPESPPAPHAQKTPPKEETRAAEDLWQSADAPFPAPPAIDHPSAGPSLWQSDQAPFPKVDIPEEEAEAAEPDELSAKRDS